MKTDVTTASDGAIVCDSLVQGVRDCNLPDGDYVFRVTGKDSSGTPETIDYDVELINEYNDVQYSLGAGETTKTISLGDGTQVYKTLVVKYHGNLTIDSGVTVTAKTSDSNTSLTYKKGMYLCVLGNLVNNGTITMTARGTYNLAGENVYLWKNQDNSFEYVPSVGGAGSPRYTGTGSSTAAKCQGTAGVGRQTGGGAKGSYRLDGKGSVGAGGDGTSYSGGSGSGAIIYDVTNGSTPNGADASDYGGPGGNAGRYGSGTWVSVALGGTGNTGGNSASNNSSYKNLKGNSGTGGLLIIYSDSLINRGTISANGVGSSKVNLGTSSKLNASGGPSGGGSVNIFYQNAISGKQNMEATGGVYSVGTGTSRYAGGNGGNGTVTVNKISADLSYAKKVIKIKAGDTEQLDRAKLKYVKQTNSQLLLQIGTVTYETLDANIATVSSNGIITGVKEGSTRIKITDTANDISTYVFLEVVNNIKMDVQEGKNFTVSLKQNGTVWAYGLNTSGQLGIGNNDNQSIPMKVDALSNIKAIGVGYAHALALTETGEVYSWGQGTNGQLGDGGTSNSNVPVKVDGLSNIKYIDAYKNISIALDDFGKVYVWGQGYSTLPMKLVFSEVVVDISGLLMLTEGGDVYSITDLTTPIDGLSNIAKISCGEAHYLALENTGIVYAWGTNTYGECGTATTGSIYPQAIAENMKNISAGNQMSIVQGDDDNVYVLGNNASKQIGLDSTAKATSLTEVNLTENVKIEVISSGEGTHSGVVDENGYVWHTGLSTYGEIGIGDTTTQNIYIKTGDSVVSTNQDDVVYLKINENITLFDILENTYNLKIDLIDDNQANFNIQLENTNSIDIADRTITSKDYGRTKVTITHIPSGKTKEITIAVVRKMESIVQGFRDIELPDGEYEIAVNKQRYIVELINYYGDMTYSLDAGETSKTIEFGDDSTEHKTLVVKYHGNLTIDSGVTLTAKTVDNLTYKKGMYICVLGDIHNNGTISMTARGTYNQEGEDVYLWHNIDSSYEFVPAKGGNGSPSFTGKGVSNANSGKGTAGVGRQTGGGAKGAYRLDGKGTVGAGGDGTAYSGGSGSGAVIYDVVNNSKPVGQDASDIGGEGGNAIRCGKGTWISAALGGTGNIGGLSASNNNTYKNIKGNNGTGGLLMLYAETLYNEGSIVSQGVDSKYVNLGTSNKLNASGGPSGGGSINIFANFVEESGTLNSNGGIYRVGTATTRYISGNGGNGTVTINLLGSILNYAKKTITINENRSYLIDPNKLSYTKLNDIQTEDLVVGALEFESLNPDIATVDNTGNIVGIKLRKNQSKNNRYYKWIFNIHNC